MDWARAIEALPLWREVRTDAAALRGEGLGPEADASASAAGLCDLFAAVPLQVPADGPRERSPTLAVFVVVSQESISAPGNVRSKVVLQAALLTSPSAAAAEARTLVVEVPGYDVAESGPFRQLLVGAGGRGLLFVSPRCCAAAAAPPRDVPWTADEPLHAVLLVPPGAVAVAKACWHPLSDAHIALLFSDGRFQLIDVSRRASLADPEVQFTVTFGGSCEIGETAADFSFGLAPSSATSGAVAAPEEVAWLAMTVLFISTKGRLSFFSPVLPSTAVFPAAVVDALSSAYGGAESEEAAEEAWRQGGGSAGLEAREWARKTVLAARREAPAGGGQPSVFRVVRHQLHLQGQAEAYAHFWAPAEQPVLEERAESSSEQSPRSPRHQRSGYSGAVLVAHSPVAVVARATSTGLVEALILSRGVRPAFQRRAARGPSEGTPLSGSVFEEVDLVPGPSRSPTLRLCALPGLPALGSAPAAPVVLARSRGLLAAIEFPWIATLARGAAAAVDGLQMACAMTLLELRAADGPGEIAGWQLFGPSAPDGGAATGLAGVLLRIKDRPPASAGTPASPQAAAPQTLDIQGVLNASAKARAAKPVDGTAASAGTAVGSRAKAGGAEALGAAEREEYLRHLSAPVILPRPLFGAAATAPAHDGPAPAAVAKAIAAVQGGQVADLMARKTVLKHLVTQLPVRAAGLRVELAELRRSGESLREAAAEGDKAAERICERQRALEARHERVLAALGAELTARGLDGLAAGELPRLWSQLHELRQAFELLRAAAAPRNPPQAARLPPEQLDTLERLQRAWTDASAGQLRARAAEADAAVEAASRVAAGPRRDSR